MPPQASPRALYQERAPFSLIRESDGWIPLDPSLLYGFEEYSYVNSVSAAAPFEIAMGTDFSMGVGFPPPVTCNVQPSSGELRPCIL